MGRIIAFPTNDMNETVDIQIERTEEFLAVAKALSDFIKGLPLSHSDNDKLISLIITQVEQAQKDAFMQGLTLNTRRVE